MSYTALKVNIAHNNVMQHNIALHRTCLEQLNQFIATLDTAHYIFNDEHTSSIGMHIRHIIEFYQELLRSADITATHICYDDRKRCMELENNPSFASETINHVIKQLDTLVYLSDKAIILSCMSADGNYHNMPSTMIREAYFVHDHTTHHMAIIAMLARALNIMIDSKFGVAQATLRHKRNNTKH